ncbi:endospore germination permease [Paenibacillus sp. PAMC21692]|uniref:GerAB/ArcD/ProY family transporter n=1 Tax=Paenibacillus sp. PAMC21692 TaxID=2762320 RepID=UPI00164E6F78|nr:endospore germination permease [Paenibacillus sp. PAMC21692]QNK57307.1 endospore germination permease [Paenibacillus sp. PAMC21692]
MTNTIAISERQFTWLVALFTVGNAILVMPSTLASIVRQDAWISCLLGIAIAILILPLYRHLGRRIAGSGMASFAEAALGRWSGKAAMVLFILAAPFQIAALTLRDIGDFMTTQIMPETPIGAVHILFLCIVVMGVRLGLETIARAVEIFVPFVFILFVLLVSMISPQIELTNVQPVLENGFGPVLKGSILVASFPLLDCGYLIMLLPSVRPSKHGGRFMLKGLLFGSFAIFVVTSLSILVTGTSNTARQTFSGYALARKIFIGGIIDRIEIIVAVIWFITVFVKLTLLLYVAASGLAATFRFRDHRSLTLPLALILSILAVLLLPNSSFRTTLLSGMALYSLIWTVGFPLLLLAVAIMRGIGREQLPGTAGSGLPPDQAGAPASGKTATNNEQDSGTSSDTP